MDRRTVATSLFCIFTAVTSQADIVDDLARDGRQSGEQILQVYKNPDMITSTEVYYRIPQVKLFPGQSLYFAVPSSLRNRPLYMVALTHRQDDDGGACWNCPENDTKPGLTSVQLHSSQFSSNQTWRYWGGHSSGPKGAKFAEARNEKEGLYDWYKKGHLSVSDDSKSFSPLYVDAVRMVSTGKDPVYISELIVKISPEADYFTQNSFGAGATLGDYLTAQGRVYGTLETGLKMPYTQNVTLPAGWSINGNRIKIPLEAGKKFRSVEMMIGDARSDGSPGGAIVSIQLNRQGHSPEMITNRENVAPRGVILAGPGDDSVVGQAGDYVSIQVDYDTAYIGAIRLAYLK